MYIDFSYHIHKTSDNCHNIYYTVVIYAVIVISLNIRLWTMKEEKRHKILEDSTWKDDIVQNLCTFFLPTWIQKRNHQSDWKWNGFYATDLSYNDGYNGDTQKIFKELNDFCIQCTK